MMTAGQTDSAPVACIRSIAHMQIPLIGGTRTRTGAGTGMGTGTGDSTQKDVGLSRYRGSPGLLPITLLMHGEGAKNARSDGMQHIEDSRSEAIPEVTVLIGGYSIGGTRPFVWTDDLEGFDLSPACPVSAIGDLSLHSLGIGGSSMLCVKSNPLSGAEESFLLSGPVGLFRGPASGINGTVAQAILNTFKTLRIVTDGPVEPKAEIQVEVEGSREDGAEAGCSFIVAETIALMLLIQSEVLHSPQRLAYFSPHLSSPSMLLSGHAPSSSLCDRIP